MHTLEIEEIRKLLTEGKVVWSQHMVIRMQNRGITSDDVENCIQSGEIIEYYQDDYPYPSCLILGLTLKNKDLHTVCGIGEEKLWVITTYYPNSEEWLEDMKTRRR